VIHPSRNKKPVSDETCRTYLSRASQCFNSKISNLKSQIDWRYCTENWLSPQRVRQTAKASQKVPCQSLMTND